MDDDLVTGERADMGDAAAHLAGADHPDLPDLTCHVCCRLRMDVEHKSGIASSLVKDMSVRTAAYFRARPIADPDRKQPKHDTRPE